MNEIAETKTRRDDFSLISCLPSPPQSRHFGLHNSITHLYGFLVVSIVANDISILTVYGNLTKWAIFHFEFNWFGIKDRRLTSKCNRPKFEFDSTASERIPTKITYVFCVRALRH